MPGGINLHAAAAPIVSAVNPMETVIVETSTGYTTSAAGRQQPVYAAGIPTPVQVQDLTQRDIRQLEGMNIQGSTKVIYFFGLVAAAIRENRRGGDLVTFSDGSVWLTTAVLEAWPGWCRVSVTLQNGK